MRKVERAKSFKTTSHMELLRRIKVSHEEDGGQFPSEPTSNTGTPTTANAKRIKLEPLTTDHFSRGRNNNVFFPVEDKKAIHKAPHTTINMVKKTFLFRGDSDSDSTPTASTTQTSLRRSIFASNTTYKDRKKSSIDFTSKVAAQANDNSKAGTTCSSMLESSSMTYSLDKFQFKKQTTLQEKVMVKEAPSLLPGISKQKIYTASSPIRKALRMPDAHLPAEVASDGDVKQLNGLENQAASAGIPYRWLHFSPLFKFERFKKHLTMTYKGLVYASKSLKSPSMKYITSKQVSVPDPATAKQKTLVLDLDETLIHACSSRDNPDIVLCTQNSFNEPMKIPLKIRPYLQDFLNKVSPLYEIIVFTASSSSYAKAIVNHIDPERKYINYMLTREHCMETKNGFFIKDLRILKNRNIKDIIIVDNLVHSFGFQIDNGVPILEFLDDSSDMELKYLADYLLKGHYYDDLREYNREKLRIAQMVERKFEEFEAHFK